jgi:hypothetical protein
MRKSGNSIRTRAMEQPSKRAQIVPGMRAYSAHNRLHVNAPTLCRFAQSYIIGGTRLGGSPRRRTAKILARTDRAPRESRQDSLRCYSGYRFPPEIIQHAIWRPFKKRGLPKAIRSDNGVPFASPNALFNLSKLAVWWLRLGSPGCALSSSEASAASKTSEGLRLARTSSLAPSSLPSACLVAALANDK